MFSPLHTLPNLFKRGLLHGCWDMFFLILTNFTPLLAVAFAGVSQLFVLCVTGKLSSAGIFRSASEVDLR